MIDVLMPTKRARLSDALEYALRDVEYRFLATDAPLQNRRVLFALAADSCGMDEQTLRLLRRLRREAHAMDGSAGALLIDGETELYTKQLAQETALAANLAGCAFFGKPLVEGTGSLYNQHILAARMGKGLQETYFIRARELVRRLKRFNAPKYERPCLLVLHASEYGRSGTLWLWQELRRRLEDYCEIREVSLQNGTIHDCRGCSYHACLHFSRSNTCFYGGAISETVLPAIRDCNAMLFLCPNYNDAVGANITALFNRLTSLLLQSDLYDKYLFGIVVSGYSGSDLVAKQLLGAMCLNKTAMLPPRFCMLQTANDLAAVQQISDIQAQLDSFAAAMLLSMRQKPE